MFTENSLIHEMDSLRRFAMKLTRDVHDADDLLQSTVLRAMEKKHLFQKDTDLFKWTSKIMYNLFVSGYRRKVRFETQYDPENYIEYQSVPASQDIVMEFLEVEEAMEDLSDDHRQVLEMICVLGMQYGEVSEALDLPVGTVRSRLFRARENLRIVLETPKSPFMLPFGSQNYEGFACLS